MSPSRESIVFKLGHPVCPHIQAVVDFLLHRYFERRRLGRGRRNAQSAPAIAFSRETAIGTAAVQSNRYVASGFVSNDHRDIVHLPKVSLMERDVFVLQPVRISSREPAKRREPIKLRIVPELR